MIFRNLYLFQFEDSTTDLLGHPCIGSFMTLAITQENSLQSVPLSTQQAIDRYLNAATRESTRRSYRTAVEHFEVTWGGYLPATADQIAMYLADYAEKLSISTLKQRLAALAVWHTQQGFPDPTKAPMVKKLLKGIKALHPEIPQSAKPLQIDQLSLLVDWMEAQIARATQENDRTTLLTQTRNCALILTGFWRGFRGDELCRMTVESTQAIADQGMTIFLPRSKTDRQNNGRSFKTPALSHLCPVTAYLRWIETANLQDGSVFRGINRWGHLSQKALHPNSIIALLRTQLKNAGIDDADQFSSHSLRRGFASWANANQWDIKTLMEYVGWKDMKSALRYIDVKTPFSNVTPILPRISKTAPSSQTLLQTSLKVDLSIMRYHKGVRTMKKTRQLLERFCLKKHQMTVLSDDRKKYQIHITHETVDQLDEIIDDLLQDMHEIARENQCLLELSFQDTNSYRRWD